MILTCPACDTRYTLKIQSLPLDGRQVKCAKCGHAWHAMPETSPPPVESNIEIADISGDTEAGTASSFDTVTSDTQEAETFDEEFSAGAEIVEDESWDHSVFDDDGDVPESSETPDIESAAYGRAWRASRRVGGLTSSSRNHGVIDRLKPAAIGSLVALAISGVLYREDVVRAVPSANGLYDLAGFGVNLRGLDFVGVIPRKEIEGGVPILRVHGEVMNVADLPTVVPALRFALIGDGGQELYSWSVEPEAVSLEPGDSLPFSTRLAAPPEAASDLVVTFVDETDRLAGLQ
ncbi:MAG: MJ0042-type zinc finger domain-containing protein [Pseudomonadota bacterium]